jgi:hypothetical protein
MEVINSSETFHLQTTRRYTLEDGNIRNYHCEMLKLKRRHCFAHELYYLYYYYYYFRS